ncbi:hypothetical protein IKF92_01735 [Candidatus Saccharibacteria bacterium]|nr:hypothetical protein [Candidatus Saccharibacteria bacterium]
MKKIRFLKHILIWGTLLLFFSITTSANASAANTQGSTLTEKYYLYAELTNYSASSSTCGNAKGRTSGCIVNIYRCNRSGTVIKSCKKIINRAKLGHANALDHVWGSNYFYVYDGWCNPATEAKCTKGCFNLDGKKASNSKCGAKANNNYGKKAGTPQGFARYKSGNDTYFIKGFSGSPGKIKIFKNGKVQKIIDAPRRGELEDVMVDCSGKYCKIYYTMHGDPKHIYGTNYKLPKDKSSSKNDTSKKSDSKSSSSSKSDSSKDSSSKSDSSKDSGSKSDSSSSDKGSQSSGGTGDGSVETVFFGNMDGSPCDVFRVMNLIIEIITYGVGISAVISITVFGIMYLTAGGDEAKVTKAKKRLFEIVIAIVVYVAVWALLNFLLPGGNFNVGSQCSKVDSETTLSDQKLA